MTASNASDGDLVNVSTDISTAGVLIGKTNGTSKKMLASVLAKVVGGNYFRGDVLDGSSNLDDKTTFGTYRVRDSALGSGVLFVFEMNEGWGLVQVLFKMDNGGIMYRSTNTWSTSFSGVAWKTVTLT